MLSILALVGASIVLSTPRSGASTSGFDPCGRDEFGGSSLPIYGLEFPAESFRKPIRNPAYERGAGPDLREKSSSEIHFTKDLSFDREIVER